MEMRKIMIATAIAVTFAVTGAAQASEDEACGDVPHDQWMSKDAAKDKATDLGYKVRRVKREDGCYEIYAISKDGARVELYLRPDTGEIVRKKEDD